MTNAAGLDELNAHFRAIGEVATLWATLELIINNLIWGLLGVDPAAGACVTSQIQSIGPRLQALAALLRHREHDEKTMKNFARFSETVERLARRRNRVVHDVYGVSQPSGEVVRFEISAFKRLEFGPKTEPVASIEALARDISAAMNSIEQLYVAVGERR